MRCIYCNTDSDYNARTKNQGRCRQCKRPFAFEPKAISPKMTDPSFQNVLNTTSVDGEVSFTERQLWYMFNRKLSGADNTGCIRTFFIICLLFFVGIIGFAFFDVFLENLAEMDATTLATFIILFGLFFVLPILLGVFAYIWFFTGQGKKPKASLTDFREKFLNRWTGAHGSIARLLPPPNKQRGAVTASLSLSKEPDLTSYSFDRLLVTQSDEIAAMLIANKFHVEARCAVVSQHGYPQDIFDDLMRMLRRNQRLLVFCLHDASLAGFKLSTELRKSRWFPDTNITLIDLGLRPNATKKLSLFTLPGEKGQLSPETRPQLTGDEISWLERGNVTEVANVPPNILLAALNRGMTQASQQLAHGLAFGGAAVAAAAGAAILLADDPFEMEFLFQMGQDNSSYIASDFG